MAGDKRARVEIEEATTRKHVFQSLILLCEALVQLG